MRPLPHVTYLKDLPSPDKYWRIGYSRRGDLTSEDLYVACGQALATWERVEDQLAILFTHLLKSESYSAENVFAVLGSSQMRINVLKAAAESYFPNSQKTSLEKDFHLTLSHYQKAASIRAKIAHGVAGSQSGRMEYPNWFLTPPEHKRHSSKEVYYLSSKEIEELTDKFLCLRQLVINLIVCFTKINKKSGAKIALSPH
jgi:hypothetical protein